MLERALPRWPGSFGGTGPRDLPRPLAQERVQREGPTRGARRGRGGADRPRPTRRRGAGSRFRDLLHPGLHTTSSIDAKDIVRHRVTSLGAIYGRQVHGLVVNELVDMHIHERRPPCLEFEHFKSKPPANLLMSCSCRVRSAGASSDSILEPAQRSFSGSPALLVT